MSKKVVDATQMAEGEAAQWANEPLDERDPSLLVHTPRPFNAEPPNSALRKMITPKGMHYRRTHTPVPVLDEATYRFSIGREDGVAREFSVADLKKHPEKDMAVTLMCTGNRRSEYNTAKDGDTMGLPWLNGSISTARWTGVALADVLAEAGENLAAAEAAGYKFLTLWGTEEYHISIPIEKGFDPKKEVILAYKMNGAQLPRDHGYPLRVIVPGYVGARSVKWIHKIVLMRNEVDGMHQKGIAYKQLPPNEKELADVPKQVIEALPPIDHVPVTSAITAPEPGSRVRPGEKVTIAGYAYSGVGLAIIRVDLSVDGGETWFQADFQRADATQTSRSGKAWAWVQFEATATIPTGHSGPLDIVCKAVDDQYNQQPHHPSPIWNLRGILNTSWGRCTVHVGDKARL